MIAVLWLRVVLSFVLPALTGVAVMASLWRGGPRLLRNAIGLGLGLGLSGLIWMFAVITSGSGVISLAASEVFLLLILVVLSILKVKRRPDGAPVGHEPAAKPRTLEKAALIFTLLLDRKSVV